MIELSRIEARAILDEMSVAFINGSGSDILTLQEYRLLIEKLTPIAGLTSREALDGVASWVKEWK